MPITKVRGEYQAIPASATPIYLKHHVVSAKWAEIVVVNTKLKKPAAFNSNTIVFLNGDEIPVV
ncbi:MAG: hypothetical protein ABIS49_03395 [Aestuariivirga sp.]|jgi:hypothetical protein